MSAPTDRAADRPAGFWRGLAVGAFGTSRAGLLGTLLVAGAWTIAAVFLVTPESVARHGYGLLSRGDTGSRTTARALRLLHLDPETPAVLLVGASDMQEAISDPADIATHLTEALGRPIRVLDLMSGGTLSWEIAALLDCVPRGFRGVVVLGMRPSRLAPGRDALKERLRMVRYGFDSEAFDSEVRLLGLEPRSRTGVYLLDHFGSLVRGPRTPVRLMLGEGRPPAEHQHRFVGLRRPHEHAQALALRRQAERLRGYDENREMHLAVLARAMERTRERGRVEFLVVEMPRNPALQHRYEPPGLRAAHRARMERFAREMDIPYLDFCDEARLAPDDYHDYCHLRRRPAMDRFTGILSRRLVEPVRRVTREGPPR